MASVCPAIGDPLTPSALTPRDIRRFMDKYGVAPRKSAGQNFVVDGNTVRRIVAGANLTADDVVLEIGPGLGSLTVVLADAVRRVVAIEIDGGLAAALADIVGAAGNVDIVHADALHTDLDALVGEPCRLVANLPYNVATPLLMHALASRAVTDAYVMVQREVGERWVAPPGTRLRAAISVKLDLVATCELVHAVPRTVFYPVPNVDSVMVRLVRKPPMTSELPGVYALVERAFSQRRKTLRNSLRGVATDEQLALAAATAGIDLSDRAEVVTTAAFVAFADALRQRP